MNLVFVDQAKNLKNAAGLYNKTINKKVNSNKKETKKNIFFLFLM